MTEKEMCETAANIAREETRKACKRYKLTPGKVIKRLVEALDATTEKKTTKKTGEGEKVVTKKIPLHKIRLKAIEIATPLLGMEPSKKIEFPDKDGNPQKVGGVIIYMPDNKRD